MPPRGSFLLFLFFFFLLPAEEEEADGKNRARGLASSSFLFLCLSNCSGEAATLERGEPTASGSFRTPSRCRGCSHDLSVWTVRDGIQWTQKL